MRRHVTALLTALALTGALLSTARAQPAHRHFASPLPGATTIATFSADEPWSGGDQQTITTPWGDSSALILSADGGETSAAASMDVDLSNSNLRLTFYTESADALDHVSLVFDVGTGDWSRIYRMDLTEINVSPGNYVVNNGWNAVAKPRRFAYSPSHLGDDDWAHIDAVRLIVGAKPGRQARVSFVRIETVPMPARGFVSITFDHVPANVPNTIGPILRARGYAASAFVTPGYVGGTQDRPWARLDQLQALHAQGWDIGLHAWSGHPDFTKLQPGQAQFQLAQGAAWLDDNGFSKPTRLWASPEATWNGVVLGIASDYFDACRCGNGSGTYPPEDKFLIRAIGVIQSETPDQLLDWVRAAAINREWLILNFHYFDEGSYEYSYDSAKFAQFVDGIAATGVDVMTISQALARLP